jgi:membrane dipeptidase
LCLRSLLRARLTLLDGVRRAIAVAVARRSGSGHHVDIRVDTLVSRIGSADFEDLGRAVGSVDQVVAIWITRLEGRTVAWPQELFAGVGYEGQLAFHNPNELVIMAMPVALAGPTAWWNHSQIDAEVRETVRVAQALAFLVLAGLVERCWITRRKADRYRGNIDLLHGVRVQSVWCCSILDLLLEESYCVGGKTAMTNRREFLIISALSAAGARASRATAAASPQPNAPAASPALLQRASELLDKAPLIDTHNDLPSALLEVGAGDLTKFDLSVRQPKLCADVPSMKVGKLGVQYWSVFVESATQKTHVSLHEAVREFDVALRLIRSDSTFEQARTAEDIERIHGSGRIACLMGVEGGHMVENSPAALRIFHELGARYLTLTHWDNIDWADAATDRVEHFGLTALGTQLVREMNRLGMFADLSHVSADTMRDALHVTRAPVIFSHSNAFALNPHPRNVPDDVLRLVRDNGGVVHVNFIRPFVSPDGHAWEERRAEALRGIKSRLVEQDAIDKAIADWEKTAGQPSATIADVANHIDHIRKVAGIDHVGIGADFYHADESDMVTGLGNVTRYPYLFAELLKRGYSDDDVLKVAGRNHLRAMRQMEKVARELQGHESPLITEGIKPS